MSSSVVLMWAIDVDRGTMHSASEMLAKQVGCSDAQVIQKPTACHLVVSWVFERIAVCGEFRLKHA